LFFFFPLSSGTPGTTGEKVKLENNTYSTVVGLQREGGKLDLGNIWKKHGKIIF